MHQNDRLSIDQNEIVGRPSRTGEERGWECTAQWLQCSHGVSFMTSCSSILPDLFWSFWGLVQSYFLLLNSPSHLAGLGYSPQVTQVSSLVYTPSRAENNENILQTFLSSPRTRGCNSGQLPLGREGGGVPKPVRPPLPPPPQSGLLSGCVLLSFRSGFYNDNCST
jgi:hypothetical protein